MIKPKRIEDPYYANRFAVEKAIPKMETNTQQSLILFCEGTDDLYPYQKLLSDLNNLSENNRPKSTVWNLGDLSAAIQIEEEVKTQANLTKDKTSSWQKLPWQIRPQDGKKYTISACEANKNVRSVCGIVDRDLWVQEEPLPSNCIETDAADMETSLLLSGSLTYEKAMSYCLSICPSEERISRVWDVLTDVYLLGCFRYSENEYLEYIKANIPQVDLALFDAKEESKRPYLWMRSGHLYRSLCKNQHLAVKADDDLDQNPIAIIDYGSKGKFFSFDHLIKNACNCIRGMATKSHDDTVKFWLGFLKLNLKKRGIDFDPETRQVTNEEAIRNFVKEKAGENPNTPNELWRYCRGHDLSMLAGIYGFVPDIQFFNSSADFGDVIIGLFNPLYKKCINHSAKTNDLMAKNSRNLVMVNFLKERLEETISGPASWNLEKAKVTGPTTAAPAAVDSALAASSVSQSDIPQTDDADKLETADSKIADETTPDIQKEDTTPKQESAESSTDPKAFSNNVDSHSDDGDH
jgi:hypothetical protein